MSLYVKTRKPLKNNRARIWFRCDDCGTYGDASGAAAAVDALAARLINGHDCQSLVAEHDRPRYLVDLPPVGVSG